MVIGINWKMVSGIWLATSKQWQDLKIILTVTVLLSHPSATTVVPAKPVIS